MMNMLEESVENEMQPDEPENDETE